MSSGFKNLVEMQEECCKTWNLRPMYGTKIDDEWKWLNFANFAKLVDQARAGMAALGIQKGDTIAIISRNSVEWAVCAYATYGLGARFVPMYETQKSTEWDYIIKDSGAKLVFAHNSVIYDVIEKIHPHLKQLEYVINLHGSVSDEHSFMHLLKLGQDNPVQAFYPESEDEMGLIYTSGTTAKPKGVILTHRNILAQVESIKQDYSFNTEDRTLSFLPWAHVFGQTTELHVLICLGFSSAFAESVPKIPDNLSEINPTILASVPRIFNKIYDAVQIKIANSSSLIQFIYNRAMQTASAIRNNEKIKLFDKIVYQIGDQLIFSKVRKRFGDQMRYALSGGAALDPAVGTFIANLGIQVFEGYGLTETSPIVSSNRDGACRIGTVGKPITGVNVKIDQDAVTDKIGEHDGEILVFGENVMKGYHNHPEDTKAVITEDGGFRTGDVGHFDQDGFLKITGRIRERYKLANGKWVVPGPVENSISLSRFVSSCMLYGENRPFNICIISVNIEEVAKYAEDRGYHIKQREIIPPDEINELLQNKVVLRLFEDELEKYTKEAKGFEIPKAFTLTAEEWSPETGMTTQTFKIRRMQVAARYADQIDHLFMNDYSIFSMVDTKKENLAS